MGNEIQPKQLTLSEYLGSVRRAKGFKDFDDKHSIPSEKLMSEYGLQKGYLTFEEAGKYITGMTPALFKVASNGMCVYGSDEQLSVEELVKLQETIQAFADSRSISFDTAAVMYSKATYYSMDDVKVELKAKKDAEADIVAKFKDKKGKPQSAKDILATIGTEYKTSVAEYAKKYLLELGVTEAQLGDAKYKLTDDIYEKFCSRLAALGLIAMEESQVQKDYFGITTSLDTFTSAVNKDNLLGYLKKPAEAPAAGANGSAPADPKAAEKKAAEDPKAAEQRAKEAQTAANKLKEVKKAVEENADAKRSFDFIMDVAAAEAKDPGKPNAKVPAKTNYQVLEANYQKVMAGKDEKLKLYLQSELKRLYPELAARLGVPGAKKAEKPVTGVDPAKARENHINEARDYAKAALMARTGGVFARPFTDMKKTIQRYEANDPQFKTDVYNAVLALKLTPAAPKEDQDRFKKYFTDDNGAKK